jgi:xanthine dehydrogenase accessory factor
MKSLFKIIEEVKAKGENSALCIIVSTSGSTPLKTGSKMLVTENGEIFGTIGGGNLEKIVIENATTLIQKQESALFNHNLVQQHGMCCGGTVSIYIEFIMRPDKLYIFGSGHVGRALAKLASDLPFEVFVVDERKKELDQMKVTDVNKVPLAYNEILPHLPFNPNVYIAVMTYDHQIDREILAYCMKKEFAYLGMIGSKRKVEITKKMFLSTQLFSEREFAEIDTPMGININAESPEEIAISIMAKLIEVKNNKHNTIKNKKPETIFQEHYENT